MKRIRKIKYFVKTGLSIVKEPFVGYINEDEEEMVKSISLISLEDEETDEGGCVDGVLQVTSDEEDQTSGETTGIPPDQAIWKVIKFVVALKQTSRQRRQELVS